MSSLEMSAFGCEKGNIKQNKHNVMYITIFPVSKTKSQLAEMDNTKTYIVKNMVMPVFGLWAVHFVQSVLWEAP